MKTQDFTTSITVNVSPMEAFRHINNVKEWWTENTDGYSENLNDTLTVTFGQTFVTLKIAESFPGKKIVWYVTDCNKHWLKNKKEWKGTRVIWEISTKANSTLVDFTHVGLVPELECYGVCENAWTNYLQNSLKNLINQSKGMPEPKKV
jgi:hypothetical protein